MTVYTPFSPDEFRAILAEYDIGDFQRSQGFEHGADQTNILLCTSTGKYAFRYYEKRPEEYVRFEIDLLHFLGDHSFPCPALALLHNLTRGHKPADTEVRTPYGAAYAWRCAQDNATYLSDPLEAEERLRWFRGELATLQLSDDLPKGVCHCDTNRSNFLYKDGKLCGVLDFDQASYTWLLYDVAQMIYWWTWLKNGDIQFDTSRDLVAQYETVRKLSDEEKDRLFDVLKLVHLVGIGWGLADDSFPNDKRKVVDLNAHGRDKFYRAIFG